MLVAFAGFTGFGRPRTESLLVAGVSSPSRIRPASHGASFPEASAGPTGWSRATVNQGAQVVLRFGDAHALHAGLPRIGVWLSPDKAIIARMFRAFNSIGSETRQSDAVLAWLDFLQVT
jgi:hypothetical protein